MDKLEILKKFIDSSDNIVCLGGTGMARENGYPSMYDDSDAYEMELEYGYSTEEIFSSVFYATRKEQFYHAYRNRCLCKEIEPNESFKSLAKLEQQGKLNSIITKQIYMLPERAGCKNVINLYGSVYKNYCTHCKTEFSYEFMYNSVGIPVCPECQHPIRPGIMLYGELLDNHLVSTAAEEVSKADLLLVLGVNLKSFMCEKILQYFNGTKMVLINEVEHFSDHIADLVIHDKVNNILPKAIKQ